MATLAGLADGQSSVSRDFTDAELIHLQRAANILRIPLRQLLHARSAQESPTPTVSDSASSSYPTERLYDQNDAAHGLAVDQGDDYPQAIRHSIVAPPLSRALEQMSHPQATRRGNHDTSPLRVADHETQSPPTTTQLNQSRTYAEAVPGVGYSSINNFDPAWSLHNACDLNYPNPNFDAPSTSLAPSSWSSLSPPSDQYANGSTASNGYAIPHQSIANGSHGSELFYNQAVVSNDFQHPLSRMTALEEINGFAPVYYHPHADPAPIVDVQQLQSDAVQLARDTSTGWNLAFPGTTNALLAPSLSSLAPAANIAAQHLPTTGNALEAPTTSQALQRHPGRESFKRAKQHRNYPTTPYEPQCFLSNRSTDKKCMQCRLEHKKCERRPGQKTGDCLRCEGLRSSGRITSMAGLPCVYYQIVDATLFRTNVDPIAKRMINYNDPPRLMAESILKPIPPMAWHPVTTKISVYQGIGRLLCLDVRPFDPRALVFSDSDRSREALFRHHYGLADLDETQRRLEEFTRGNVEQYIRRLIRKHDILTRGVFEMALRMRDAKKDPVLGDVLQLWTAARFVEGGWRYANTETLGLEKDPETGIVELPESEIIDYQVCTIIIHNVLMPLRQRVTKRLQALIHSKKPQFWLTIFLTSFILLHSFTLLMRQQVDFSSEFAVQVKYTNMRLIRNILMDAKAILFHFHYINKGVGPFLLDWSGTTPPRTAKSIFLLNEEESMFVRRISREVKERREAFRRLAESNRYEDEYWFTGQLFLDKWLPTEAINIEVSPPRTTSMP